MRNFLRLAQGIDTMPILHALQMNSELWNQHTFRTKFKNTPHVDVDDIWLRFSSQEKVADPEKLDRVIYDDAPVWYPAASRLPVKTLVLDVMRRVEAFDLGRLLITRIKPGGRILPHADVDGSYVNAGNIARYHVVLQGLPGNLFRCGDETISMLTGEVYWFNAHVQHECMNNSADDRIHLLVDVRLWP